jgi:hypothetical protein
MNKEICGFREISSISVHCHASVGVTKYGIEVIRTPKGFDPTISSPGCENQYQSI